MVVVSSWVGFGHVGLSAAAPVLTALGHEVVGLPTVVLSNHPGFPHVAGRPTEPKDLAAMFAALDANGWLADVSSVLTGYLPTPDHVAVAEDVVARVRQIAPAVHVVVDPVLGDAPKGLYIPENAALALRDRLVPLADTLTPNAFELGWLTGDPVDQLDAFENAAQRLLKAGVGSVLTTSAPVSDKETGVLAVRQDGTALYPAPLRHGVPHGTGDVFAAMIAAGLAPGEAVGMLDALIGTSIGADHLRITETAKLWTKAQPIPPA